MGIWLGTYMGGILRLVIWCIGLVFVIFLNLFVGWVYLWAWYIFSLRMRVRMVTTDRIIRIM